MGIEPISLHSRWIASPPFRRIAPATPPPNCRSLLAAFTTASVSISVRSPCWIIFGLAKFIFSFIVRSLHVINPVPLLQLRLPCPSAGRLPCRQQLSRRKFRAREPLPTVSYLALE